MARLLALLIILALPLLPCPVAARGGSTVATSLETNLAEQQKRIKKVQKEIEEKRNRLRDTRAREASVLGQLEELNHALGSGRGKLARLSKEAAAKREAIQHLNDQLNSIIASGEAAREHLKKRLAAFYRMGEIGTLNVVFSSASLADLLNIDESFRVILTHDRKIIDDYRQQAITLTRIRDDLQRETARLGEVIADSEKQAKKLADNRASRLRLLATINKEKQLYQQALAEMDEAAANLNQTMTLLREKLAAEKSAPAKKQPAAPGQKQGAAFETLKGRLPPPVKGAVATYFGKNNPSKFGVAPNSAGVDIKTVAGAEVAAIHPGKVVYVGRLRGYGNLMIIDHGHQYYSLLSRVAEFHKKEGETVMAGEVVGAMGDEGGLLGEGLHFEIRRGTEALDPLEWINRALLRAAPAPPPPGKGRRSSKNN